MEYQMSSESWVGLAALIVTIILSAIGAGWTISRASTKVQVSLNSLTVQLKHLIDRFDTHERACQEEHKDIWRHIRNSGQHPHGPHHPGHFDSYES